MNETAEAPELMGLDERLDRLLVTDEAGQRFILSTKSAQNIAAIAREWLRVERQYIHAQEISVTLDMEEAGREWARTHDPSTFADIFTAMWKARVGGVPDRSPRASDRNEDLTI